MNAANFNHLIYSPADKGIAASELEQGVQAYPWCQPMRVVLSVRAYAEGSFEKEELLGQAAVHTFHRARLKQLHGPYLKDGKVAESPKRKAAKAEPKPEAVALPESEPAPQPARPRAKASRPSPISDPTVPDEQNKLIDEFLASQEGIRASRKELGDEPKPDLAAKSVSFDGLILSETMARMYMRQGQPEKAAYIVSQLSLKNPEKSAYFAEILKSGEADA